MSVESGAASMGEDPPSPPTPSAGSVVDPRFDRARSLVGIAREYGIVISFALLFVTLSLASNVFLSWTNLTNILDQQAAIGIMAVAGTLVIIGGNFDISIGAIYGVAGVTAAQVANSDGATIGFLAGAGIGLGLGLVNAILITTTRINSFIGTLATSIMFQGLGLAISGGTVISATANHFDALAVPEIAGIKMSVYIFLAVTVVLAIVLGRTMLGRYIFAVGGNAEAARLSGVRVRTIHGATFAISGLAAGIAGVIVASRTGSGIANSGLGLELTTIAAVVVGGTSILGGEGAIWRSVLGVLLLALIGNGFNLLNVNPTYQQTFTGAIIVAAVALDALTRRRR
jgi:ribose transport system permease protein